MKQKFFLAASFLLSVLVTLAQDYRNLSFTPASPKPGDVITFEYSTSGTMLGGIRDFDAFAYVYDGEVRAQDVKLLSAGNRWKGEIKTNDSSKVVFLSFKKDKLIDNNKEQGYSIMMMDNGQPVKGAYAAMAEVTGGVGGIMMQMKADHAANLAWYEKEFSRDPSYRSKVMYGYGNTLVRLDKATAYDKLKPALAGFLDKKTRSESDYQMIIWAYERVAGDKEAAEAVRQSALEKFPKGQLARGKKISAFYDEKDFSKKEEILNSIARDFPPANHQEEKSFDNLYMNLASMAASKDDMETFRKYEAKVSNKQSLAGTYNNIAWKLTGESIDAPSGDLALAKQLSGKSLEYTKAAMSDMSNKPPYQTEKQYKQNQETTYGLYADTYALILWKSGEFENAYNYQEQAVKSMNFNDAEANERFVIFKEKLKGAAAVKEDIVGYVRDGKSSLRLKELLKKAYLAEGKNEAEFEAFVEGLQKEFQAKHREDILKKMISETAPRFALKDLTGKTVSLDELKGKVVVVDFWATWCGPCIASFPGMQMAVNKYKSDPNVKFVFVDTWEGKKPDEMQKDATDFMAKKKYDFNVLLDTDDKIVTSYGVEGIPTKFVIDGDSRIRFRSVGFDGSADKLVEEISIVVDALKAGTTDGTKKGF